MGGLVRSERSVLYKMEFLYETLVIPTPYRRRKAS